MAASVTREQFPMRADCTDGPFPVSERVARAPVLHLVEPERVVRRGWWLRQARHAIVRARGWMKRFGGAEEEHAFAVANYLEALLEADRYRTWARERR
jgi:hypothetical protein